MYCVNGDDTVESGHGGSGRRRGELDRDPKRRSPPGRGSSPGATSGFAPARRSWPSPRSTRCREGDRRRDPLPGHHRRGRHPAGAVRRPRSLPDARPADTRRRGAGDHRARPSGPGASPQEVEREIVDEQEEQLKSLEGLVRMESSSADSMGTDHPDLPGRHRHRQRAAEGLEPPAAGAALPRRRRQAGDHHRGRRRGGHRLVRGLRPTEENGFEGEMSTLYDFVEDFIKPEFERVPGVGPVQPSSAAASGRCT